MILPMQGGVPAVGELTYHGHVLIEQYKGAGLYMVTGKADELNALSKLKGAVLITVLTDKGEKPWAEMDAIIDKSKANALAVASEKPTLTDKDTVRETMLKMVKNKNFERTDWVKEE
jgi:hypothetical protein